MSASGTEQTTTVLQRKAQCAGEATCHLTAQGRVGGSFGFDEQGKAPRTPRREEENENQIELCTTGADYSEILTTFLRCIEAKPTLNVDERAWLRVRHLRLPRRRALPQCGQAALGGAHTTGSNSLRDSQAP